MNADRPEHGVDEPNKPGLVIGLMELPGLTVRGVVAVETGGGRNSLGGDGDGEEPLAPKDLEEKAGAGPSPLLDITGGEAQGAGQVPMAGGDEGPEPPVGLEGEGGGARDGGGDGEGSALGSALVEAPAGLIEPAGRRVREHSGIELDDADDAGEGDGLARGAGQVGGAVGTSRIGGLSQDAKPAVDPRREQVHSEGLLDVGNFGDLPEATAPRRLALIGNHPSD